jgi:hypothetical protein
MYVNAPQMAFFSLLYNLEIHGLYSNGSPDQQNFVLDPRGAVKQCPSFWNLSHVENSWNITIIF